MFKNKFLLFSLISLIWAPQLFSQMSIDLEDRGLETYQDIFVSDLDFFSVGGAKELFAIKLEKDISGAANGRIRIMLKKGGDVIASLETNNFQFPVATSSGQPWIFTNVQLSNGSYRFRGLSGATAVRISNSELIKDNAGTLVKEIESTNKIPFGVYRLEAVLEYQEGNGPIMTDRATRELIINITNPYILSQISPGNILNSGFVYQLYTLNPVFQWNGNSGDYQVVVFKKQSDFSDPEDILNSQPVWESPRGSNLFLQYPEGGAVPLEYGAQYVWQVRSIISTSSGENILQSELWEFEIIDPSSSGITRESMANQEFQNLLRQLMGDNAEAIIREVGNFKLSTVRVNGQIISTQELYRYLEKYRDQQNEISDITLRSSN